MKGSAEDRVPHLVRFNDGSYGVRRKSRWGGWEYAGHLPDHWWRQSFDQAHNYAMTEEKALNNWAYRAARLGEGERVEATF